MVIILNNIRVERLRLGWSQQDLAEYLEISEPLLSRWEEGSPHIPIGKLIELSELFNCSIEFILKRTNKRY